MVVISANEKLGLPRSKMQKIAICFDVDGTLITASDQERERVTRLLLDMHKLFKNSVLVVWSGGGSDYARTHAERLGLGDYVHFYMSKLDHQILRDRGYKILAIDDIQDTALGDINLVVRQ